MDQRLVNIEEKIAHLERHLGELDGVVREVFDRMDGFKNQIDRLREDFTQHLSGEAEPPEPGSDERLEEDKPPHW